MFEIDRQWIERVHNCMYKAKATNKEDLLIKLKKLEFKFFNISLEEYDYEQFNLIEEKLWEK